MNPRPPDRVGAGVALAIAVVAALALWGSRSFSMFGSIFPRTIAIAMLLGSLFVAWRELRGRGPSKPREREGFVYGVALVVVMSAWIAALEWAGFALSSGVAFLALALIARRERPTLRRTLLLALASAVLVVGLQMLFERVLSVRLPDGFLAGIL